MNWGKTTTNYGQFEYINVKSECERDLIYYWADL